MSSKLYKKAVPSPEGTPDSRRLYTMKLKGLWYDQKNSCIVGGGIVDTINNWRFCAVGNIKAQHTDDNGKVLYGTKAFRGGTKVYIDDRTWTLQSAHVSVIGLNRFHRYTVESVPVNLIENVRAQRVFKPTVLGIMDYLEALDGWPWRRWTEEDRNAINAFVEMWKAR